MNFNIKNVLFLYSLILISQYTNGQVPSAGNLVGIHALTTNQISSISGVDME